MNDIEFVLLVQTEQFAFRRAEEPDFGAAPLVVIHGIIELRRFLHPARSFRENHDVVSEPDKGFCECVYHIFESARFRQES